MAGRKGILEFRPEKAELFLEALRAGNYACVSCDYAGFSESSLYAWLQHGEADKEAGETTVYTEFLESYKKADTRAEYRAVLTVSNAALEDWKAAMTYLERRRPERWGRRDALNVKQSGTVNVKLQNLDDEELDEYTRLTLKAEGDDGAEEDEE